jgi:cell wall-associated NlpC family hydrolase
MNLADLEKGRELLARKTKVSGDLEKIRDIAADWRLAAGGATEYTGTLATTTRTVDAAWQGKSANAFITYMNGYTIAADTLSDALTACATTLDTTANALGTAKTNIGGIITRIETEAGTFKTNYLRDNAEPDQAYLRRELEKIIQGGISEADGEVGVAEEAVTTATTTITGKLGAGYFNTKSTFDGIGAAGGESFVPKDGRKADWQPTPGYQGPTTTRPASYGGPPGGPDSGNGYGGGGYGGGGGGGYGGGGGTALPYVIGTGTGADIVNAARQHLGKPYIWGANGPSAFDCSGLLYYAMNQAGIKIGDTTAEGYQASGKPITGPPQPGDMVFFGDPPTHCGIYIGNGQMINAPHSGAVVRIEDVEGKQPITYRRFT